MSHIYSRRPNDIYVIYMIFAYILHDICIYITLYTLHYMCMHVCICIRLYVFTYVRMYVSEPHCRQSKDRRHQKARMYTSTILDVYIRVSEPHCRQSKDIYIRCIHVYI